MGVRIHRAMGWGLPWFKFEELTSISRGPDGGCDFLQYRFEELTDADLTVDDESYSRFFNQRHVMPIFEKRLLSKTYTDGGRRPAVLGNASDLFCSVGCDETEHVIFFPSLYYREKWYRYDDDMDYAFERWRDGEGRGEHSEPRDFYSYVEYGHYPWTNYVMLEDGTPTPWEHFLEVNKHPEWVPAVPCEIRWYLTKHNILKDDGVNQLRPIVAQWWS
jgi:hypothetical protein